MKREIVLQYFEYKQLPVELQNHSKSFWALAHHICNTIPESTERTLALYKLVEARDAAIRAVHYDVTRGDVQEVLTEQDQRPAVRGAA